MVILPWTFQGMAFGVMWASCLRPTLCVTKANLPDPTLPPFLVCLVARKFFLRSSLAEFHPCQLSGKAFGRSCGLSFVFGA